MSFLEKSLFCCLKKLQIFIWKYFILNIMTSLLWFINLKSNLEDILIWNHNETIKCNNDLLINEQLIW